MKRLDEIKDDLQEFDRQATGNPTLEVAWNFDRYSWVYGSFSSGHETSRPPTIELNYPTIERWYRTLSPAKALRRLQGLNFHELGHALYTPQHGERLDSSLSHFSNLLEDQRVELLIIERYPDSERCLAELLSGIEVLSASLTHGRPYTSASDRHFYDRRFEKTYGRPALDSLREIIDTYVALGPGTTEEELRAHARRLQSLMVDLGAYVPIDDPFHFTFDSP